MGWKSEVGSQKSRVGSSTKVFKINFQPPAFSFQPKQ
jgi:hypothetical protein